MRFRTAAVLGFAIFAVPWVAAATTELVDLEGAVEVDVWVFHDGVTTTDADAVFETDLGSFSSQARARVPHSHAMGHQDVNVDCSMDGFCEVLGVGGVTVRTGDSFGSGNIFGAANARSSVDLRFDVDGPAMARFEWKLWSSTNGSIRVGSVGSVSVPASLRARLRTADGWISSSTTTLPPGPPFDRPAYLQVSGHPELPVAPGDLVLAIEVEGHPSFAGAAAAQEVLTWELEFELRPTTLASMAVDLVEYYADAIAGGGLEGLGPGGSGRGRSIAFGHFLDSAARHLAAHREGQACKPLHMAYLRSDGLPAPPDFVGGPDVQSLHGRIHVLGQAIGCADAAAEVFGTD